MKKIDGIEIRDIEEKNLVSESVKILIHQYGENAKLWKGAFIAFLAALVLNYLIGLLFGNHFEDGFANSKIGFFFITFMTLSFIAFAILFIRERRFTEKKWHCPTCEEKFPYFKTEKECKGRSFLMDCHDLGIRQGRIPGKAFIIPCECPNCGEKIWKE